jgi:peptidyl-prolyl cis-trans isomerase SurA
MAMLFPDETPTRMKFQSTLLPLLAAAALLSTPSASHAQTLSNLGAKNAPESSPYKGTVVEDIIARVNDQVVSQSDYNRALADLDQQAAQRNWTQTQTDAAKKDMLRDLIDQQLLLSRGKEMSINGDAETVRQLDELRKQNHLDSMEDLQKAAEQQGVSFEDFKASIRNRVITSQVIREEVGRRINLTTSEEQAYYDAHKADFDRPEQVRLSEILIPTPNADDAAQVQQAEAKAAEVEAQLKGGKDFAALAKTNSGGPTAADGGVIGDFKRGQLAKVLEDATFGLKPGEYTAPMRTKQGVIILKVDSHQAGGIAPFADVEGQVQDQLGMSKMEPALRAYLTRLREEAYIAIKPGFVDSGASPNEQRIIFSAYQPPQPKKKKKLQRTRFTGRGRAHATRPAPVEQAAATSPSAPAAPAGVPSLADVPQGTSSSPAAAASSAAPPAPAAAPTRQVAQNAGTQKPGKREKVRFGQAPRETLPASNSTTSVDAGASAENGNGSVVEQAAAAQGGGEQVARTDQPPPTPGSAPIGARYATGESADEPQATTGPEKKTRFSDRAKLPKAPKKKKDAVDPMQPAAATPDEVATRQEQSAPLGLAGDMTKKQPKPKPTGPKTRYADEHSSKSSDQLSTPAPASSSASPTAPTAMDTPASPAGPSANPNAQAPNGNPAPVRAQDTPNGTGDPLGPTVPAPAQPQ